jgi:hypothetical protein
VKDFLPYGLGDFSEQILSSPGNNEVRCYVKDCDRWLKPPRRGERGTVCPEHGITCFHSSSGNTVGYRDVRRNMIASPDLMATRIVGHPFKYESHRLGLERSEDALTWNVFRSLQEAGQLAQLAQRITGDSCGFQPYLMLWGIDCSENTFEPWDLLVQGRRRFESRLPVDRPFTEPDIAIFLPGRYLILIEAKFTSFNTAYHRGPRKNASSLTLEELINIYADDQLIILDRALATRRERIYYQLWRNLVFAEWMARQDHPDTKAFHVNLVRAEQDEESAAEFAELVRPEFHERFQRWTWEQLHQLFSPEPKLSRMRRYLENKTAGLKPAFRLSRNDSKKGAAIEQC